VIGFEAWGRVVCLMLVGGTLYWMVVPEGIVMVWGICWCPWEGIERV
jgi:hypothetical protein